LLRNVEERLKKASERKDENDRQRERQIYLKKELEKLKQEEITELKKLQEKQRLVIKR
jgi:hypothetical protein